MEAILFLLLITVPVAAAAKGLGRRRIWFAASLAALAFAVAAQLISVRGTLSAIQNLGRPVPISESARKEVLATPPVPPGKAGPDDRAAPSVSDSYSRLTTRLFASLCLGMLLAGLFYRSERGPTERAVAVTGVLPSPPIPPSPRAPEELWVTVRDVQGIVVLDLRGRLVLGEDCSIFRERWRQLSAANKARILVNLKDVSRVDSTGIGSLVEAVIETTKQGGQLKLVKLPRLVKGVLRVHRLSAVFEVHESEEQAVASFRL